MKTTAKNSQDKNINRKENYLEFVFALFREARFITVAHHIFVTIDLRNNLAVADQRLVS